MNSLPLQDRVVVIVGGTSGLGLSAALACLEAGGRVVACGLCPQSVVEARSQLGSLAQVTEADATMPETAGRLIDQAYKAFGRFDALYHVAGGSGRRFGDGPLHEVTDQAIESTLELNLNSVLFSNRAAVNAFLAQGTPGAILNMSSVLAFSPSPHFFATHVYAAAKAGILGLTRSCAAYYATHNIRFNAIVPALVDTPMATRAVGDEAIQRYIQHKQPLDGGRVGLAEDLQAAVVYFLSDQSRYVTGQVLAVDGGWCVSEGRWELDEPPPQEA
jgi:NAD(P)-dependent dehydrogenase (short-subunit alcohol dehydrogenase family)